jgi:hypothetical protein
LAGAKLKPAIDKTDLLRSGRLAAGDEPFFEKAWTLAEIKKQ